MKTNSIEEYLSKYSEICEKRGRRLKLRKEQREGCLTPTPQSFLHHLGQGKKKSDDITEEIFNEEKQKFYLKLVNSRSGSPYKTPPPTFSPMIQKKNEKFLKTKTKMGSPLIERTEIVLPVLRKLNEKKSERMKSENSLKIEKIVKNCEDTRNCVAESSSRLRYLVNQESLMTKMYAKEVKWTSDVLMRIGGHDKKILQTLYDEYKSSDEFYEKEKNDVLDKMHLKTLEDFRTKAKNMKKIMMNYRQKIIQ